MNNETLKMVTWTLEKSRSLDSFLFRSGVNQIVEPSLGLVESAAEVLLKGLPYPVGIIQSYESAWRTIGKAYIYHKGAMDRETLKGLSLRAIRGLADAKGISYGGNMAVNAAGAVFEAVHKEAAIIAALQAESIPTAYVSFPQGESQSCIKF